MEAPLSFMLRSLANTSLGERAGRRGQEIVVPVLDPLDTGKVLAGILLRDDLGSNRMQPFVAVGMVEVPVRVDEVGDWIDAELRQRLGDLGTRYADAGVDEHLAVGAGQNGDVAPGAFEDADIVAQSVRDDRRNGGAVLDQADEAAGLREGFTRGQPPVGGGE
jgi:hypothetical protein